MVARGYIVAATDYPGPRHTGAASDLVGESGGRAVLDIVRVARNLPGRRRGQGVCACGAIRRAEQAVLFAAQPGAGLLAPELRVHGITVSSRRNSYSPTLINNDINSVGSRQEHQRR